MSNSIRIAVADDHPIVRKGLCQTLEEQPHLTVVAEASDGATGLAQIRELRPDVAILDLHMPKLDGLDIAEEVKKENLAVKIIILTMHSEAEFLHRALDLGVKGYVLKDCALLEIVRAVDSVVAGTPYVTPSLTPVLLSHSPVIKAPQGRLPELGALTPSERRILEMIAAGKPTKDIASELGVHPRTVETHRGSICNKLGLSGANSLLRFALGHKSEILPSRRSATSEPM
jgi:DNA-binding NarL/FixJ family response regulator